MPCYDYECVDQNCGHRVELIHSMQDTRTRRRCPKCGKRSLQRLLCAGVRPGRIRPQQYPYYNWQLPPLPGETLGEPNVMSKAHEDEICAGARDGIRYERNAI